METWIGQNIQKTSTTSLTERSGKKLGNGSSKTVLRNFEMKTFMFAIKNNYDDLVSFSLDSDLPLRELVKSKEFLKKLQDEDFFDADFMALCSEDWSCFSTEENVKGITKHETFDIEFFAKRTWSVELPC